MTCTELTVLLLEAEEQCAAAWHYDSLPPAVTVAAFAFCELLPPPDTPLSKQLSDFVHLISMLLKLRQGLDPRCDSCRRRGKFNQALRHTARGESIQ